MYFLVMKALAILAQIDNNLNNVHLFGSCNVSVLGIISLSQPARLASNFNMVARQFRA